MVADPAAARLRISGVFYTGENSGFLEALPMTHPVLVETGPNMVSIRLRSDKKTSSSG